MTADDDKKVDDAKPPQAHASASTEMASLSTKAPAFWKSNPAVWFVQIEAQFESHRITKDRTKYNYVISAIDTQVLDQVSDLILDPPEEERYLALKERLLNQFSDTEQTKLKKLLSELELGTKRPSHLLREMKALSKSTMNVSLLKSLWLQRLPNNVQAILSISSEPLEKLSELADKIIEVSPLEVNAVHTSTSGVFPTQSSVMENQIASLVKQVAELNTKFNRQSRADSRHRSNFRVRSRTPSAAANNKNKNRSVSSAKDGKCWYHRKFGDKATRCTIPCSAKSPLHSENQ